MSNASQYTEKNILAALLRGVAFPLPAKVYVSLHTADPQTAGGNEVTTAAWPQYVRRDTANGGAMGTGWSDPGSGNVSNNSLQITFPSNNGAAPVTITHWALWDAATNGNFLLSAPLNTSRVLQPGDVLVFDTTKLSVTAS